MPVPNSINELDTAAANNSPQGSETAKGNIDNYLRAGFAFIRQLFDTTWKPGMIGHTAASSAPTGWLAADGSAVSRTAYAALFAAIGTTYGAGDGVTTFNLPDLRGEFVRGLDSGRGVDTGRTLGSTQSSQNLAHTHTGTTSGQSANHTHSGSTSTDGYHTHPVVFEDGVAYSIGAGSTTHRTNDGALIGNGATRLVTTGAGDHSHLFSTSGVSSDHTHGYTTSSNGGTEARPRNIALLAIIKT